MPDSKSFRLGDCTEDPACIAEDAELNRRIAAMGFAAYQRAKMNGAPVARYDAGRKQPYLLHPDGRREYDA